MFFIVYSVYKYKLFKGIWWNDDLKAKYIKIYVSLWSELI